MKRIVLVLSVLLAVFSLSGCLKHSPSPCSECGSDNAYVYKIDHIDKKVLEEKIEISYCKACYDTYLEKTFGNGALAHAQEEDAHFKDVIGAGGYLDDLVN